MTDSITTPSRRLTLYGILFSVALFLSVLLFFGYMVRPFNPSIITTLFLSRLAFWACLAIVFVFTARIEKQPFLWWKGEKYPVSFYVVSFMAILSIIFFSSIGVAVILKLTGATTTSKVVERLIPLFKQNMALMVFTCFTAGIVEEFFFRGYLMPRLQLLLKNKYVIILISAGVFGAFHFGYGTVGNVVVPFVIGIVFAVYYYNYRNLWLLVACHFTWDLLVLLSAIGLQGKPHPIPQITTMLHQLFAA